MSSTRKVRTFAGRLNISQRTVQRALGAFWILDAALQYQPRMWGHAFVSDMISPMAVGQPAPLAWLVKTVAHFIGLDPGAWNFLFATLQLGIGVGLLFRRTVRTALAVMFAWVLGIWCVGEGLGQIFTAHTSPLAGAPGAAFIYALIGVLVWPKTASKLPGVEGHRIETPGEDTGLATAAGARGLLGVHGPVFIWAGLWSMFAVIWVLPANRVANSIHDTVAGMALGEPGWYAHLLHALGNHMPSGGTPWAWTLALISLVIGFGPLVSRRVVWFFVAGAALELLFWVSGQAFGGMLTGMGTDPNTGPLVALLGLAAVPVMVEVPIHPTDALHAPRSVAPVLRRIITSRPIPVSMATAGLGGLLLLSATYPLASTGASASSVMADMPGMQPVVATSKAKVVTSSDASMPGMKSMASSSLLAPEAMGGTDPTWRYYGPPLSSGETNLLLSVSAMTDAGHKMQTPTCAAIPSASQLESAIRLVQETSADVAQYSDLSSAQAAGYEPVTTPAYPVVHYVKAAYLSNQYVLDPNHVDSLVYATTPYGQVLVAAMFLMPEVGNPGPMPAGCMLQWHAHTNLCTSTTTHLIIGFTPCSPGTVHTRTAFMAHIWQVPVPGGPLALDPSDLQTVEGAIMAQQCGEAPYDPATPPPAPSPGECVAYYGYASSPSNSSSNPSAFALAP